MLLRSALLSRGQRALLGGSRIRAVCFSSTASASSSSTGLDLPSMAPKTLELAQGLLKGERVCLSRAITLIESTNPEHEKQAELLLEYVLKNRRPGKSAFRLGITGPPGAGKSTFIEALGTMVVKEMGHRLAVIAVDPSSTRTHGSILGDKTRMAKLSVEERAFVRPSPTRGRLGGIAQHTNEVILLAESAGFDTVFVETVGLGQSEIEVDQCVDMLLLLVPPANGDELQGVKKGVMEVADMIVVNKADGDLKTLARHAVVDYSHAVQLARRKREGWTPPVKKCSAATGENLKTIWEEVSKFKFQMRNDIADRRMEQSVAWMWSNFDDQLIRYAHEDPKIVTSSANLQKNLTSGQVSPRHAARDLMKVFLETLKATK